jgi:hypothetical protein
MIMIFLLALTAEQFSAVALAWIGALGVVAVAIGAFLVKITPVIHQVTELMKRADRQGIQIQSQQGQIVDLATKTPTAPPTIIVQAPQAPSNGAPIPVEVQNEPLKVKET